MIFFLIFSKISQSVLSVIIIVVFETKLTKLLVLIFKMSKIISLEDQFESNKKLTQSDLDDLKHWYSKQAHLPPISDELLILFLHSCEFELNLTKTTIDNYFTFRTLAPELFANRNPFAVNVINGNPVVHYAFLSKCTSEGYKIMVLKFSNTDPSAYVFSEQIKAFNMHLDIELHLNGTFPGLIVVFDMEGTTLGHVTRLNVNHMKKILYYVQDAMPVRLRGIHYINVVPFMDVIMGIMKPFLKKSLLEMLHIHTQGMDSFYKFIPKEILPRDLGGEDFSTGELYEKSLKILQTHQKWFEEESKLRVDESKRIDKPKYSELFGMDGSFKKLNLD